MRPGPESIAADTCPDGLVLHAYSLRGELLRESCVLPSDADRKASDDALSIAADPRAAPGVILVVYDGDSGDRWTQVDYSRTGCYPATTHRWDRIGTTDLLRCRRCGLEKLG